MTTTNQIWPGPERLKSTPDVGLVGSSKAAAVARARRIQELSRTLGPFGAVGQLVREHAQGRRVLVRMNGIAQCRAKARARMERFVAWLKDDGRHSSARSTAGFLSPEAWMETQASSVHTWFRARLTALNVAPRWAGRFYGALYTPKRASALAVALLRSPEWLSLPWQRESEGVGRG